MNQLGETRTRVRHDHALIAPDGHVETVLPGWKQVNGVILTSPQMGARHSHFLARFEQGGEAAVPLPGVERFVYALDGRFELEAVGEKHLLESGGFAYLPSDQPHRLAALGPGTLNLYERRYIPLPNFDRPALVVGADEDIPSQAFLGDPSVQVKKFLPEDPRFDMAVNTMTFEPGAGLPFAETHFMEHGALILAGGGIYRLGEAWYPVQTHDALWMGPYCPQWFGALGKENSSYLLYKEANRDVFAFEKES